MTIKCIEKFGEVCQRRIGTTLLTLIGIMSFTAIFYVLVSL
jgi:hypothetical protein